jgi:acyl-CoA synthetase (AMP-forming)/AMP-acid ligase II
MYGDETALIERDFMKKNRRVMTWREFDRLASSIANALIGRGTRRGDKVIHIMMNCLEWLPIYFGILRTAAWAVPLNYRFTAEDINQCVDMAEGKAIFFGEEFVERISEIREDLETVEHFIFVGDPGLRPDYAEQFEGFLAESSGDEPDISLNPSDEAALYFSSGTTGAPKPVLLTHRNLEFACIIENRHHNQTHDDNFLCIPPLYHTGAKMHWFGNLIVGARAVIIRGVTPEWILRTVSEERVTIVWLLVPWAQDILLAIENQEVDLNDYELDQWRLMHIGAQPVPPSLIRKWKKVFPSHDYDTNYGLSEATGPGCVHLGMENLHKVGAIGIPGFHWECKIVDEHLNLVPIGQTGELAVKGPCVMKEYYRNPEATQNALLDGWLLTGDMARFDEDGFIWLVDRKKDLIKTGGESIFPVEIENFLMENERIQDAAVIGIPDERLGEIVAAVIKPKPGRQMTEQGVIEYCESLPRYKRPRMVYFDDIPRNPTGKIEKPKLRKKYGGIFESFIT